ncbi:MAG TPA: metal ABC transporter permease [Streptosporangiaceae bacterium]|nr:metal ABC transporter permease [Streptosporangiaceae bacterium]
MSGVAGVAGVASLAGLRSPDRGAAILASGPITGLAHIMNQPFLRYAFIAGAAIAIASGLVGYFVVLRSQVFTGDALSHVAFTGALAALAAGADLLIGLYGACVLVALAMAALGTRGQADDTVIGSVFAWILGLGALFLTIYTTSATGANGTSGVNVLFGTIFGLSAAQTVVDTAVTLAVSIVVIVIGRPLLFASIDPAVASARKVPVRVLGFLFLGLVGVTAAAATQAVGALLLLGLLAAPAGAAQRVTARPFLGLWLSAAIAIVSVWTGLLVAYSEPGIPPSFGILAVATVSYLTAIALTSRRTVTQRS